ncbi:MAG: mechanosensitive ion channel [Caldithrix sp.]|nr:mechanosensitive ion channel [Caldithrix sp.]
MQWLNKITDWLTANPLLENVVYGIGILLLSYLGFILTNYFVVRLLKKIAQKSKTNFDDFLVESPLLRRLSFIVPVLIIYNFAALFPPIAIVIQKICQLLLLWLVLRSITAFLNAFNKYYETQSVSKERPIKGYIQIAIIILYILSIIVIIGLLTGQSPWVLLSGVGALTAVILLIFRDTILSFVAGIQIASYDLVHVGDWIEMSKFGADGDVIDIALHTVKVQNWDKTIVSIPTHKLTEESFKNWRGMQQAGGRRIKRAVYIDQNSIKFLDREQVARFRKVHLITDYVDRKQAELEAYNRKHNIDESTLINGRRMTNLGTFRAYINAYISKHPKINPGLTHMIRQLPPGPEGVPIEIYFFITETIWKNYEQVQADVFDHILAIVPLFDLRIFQNPTGGDFQQLIRKDTSG